MRNLLIYLIVAVSVVSCGDKHAERKKIERLDIAMSLYADMSRSERDSLINVCGDVIDAWFAIMGRSVVNDSVLEAYSDSRVVTLFTFDVNARFLAMDSVECILALLEKSIRDRLENKQLGRLLSVVSPYNQSIFTIDSIMFIGLNHYLGSDYAGYDYFEIYQRATKTAKHLPYDVAEAFLAQNYPYKPDDDATVLTEMLYHGAVLYAVMSLVSDADLQEALGYDTYQMEWVEENESEMWNALISRGLLYSTSQADADRLMRPSPATMILHQDCPGRAGRYIGYRIVCSYMSNFERTSLDELLKPSFYSSPQSLVDAKYLAR